MAGNAQNPNSRVGTKGVTGTAQAQALPKKPTNKSKPAPKSQGTGK